MADEQIKESRGWLIDFLANIPLLSWLVPAEKNEQDVVTEEAATTVDTSPNTEETKPEPEKTPESVIEQEQVEQAAKDQAISEEQAQREEEQRQIYASRVTHNAVKEKLYAGAVTFGQKIKGFFDDIWGNEPDGQSLPRQMIVEENASLIDETNGYNPFGLPVEYLENSSTMNRTELLEMRSREQARESNVSFSEVSGGIEADDINAVTTFNNSPSNKGRSTS